MQDAVDQNLTRSIGVSNFSPEKIDEWFSDARIYPAVNQVRQETTVISQQRFHGTVNVAGPSSSFMRAPGRTTEDEGPAGMLEPCSL